MINATDTMNNEKRNLRIYRNERHAKRFMLQTKASECK